MAASSRALRDPRHMAPGTVLLYLGLLVGAVVTIVPIAYMFSQGFTPESETMVWPIRWIPQHPTLDNFRRVFSDPTLPVFRWFLNSHCEGGCNS